MGFFYQLRSQPCQSIAQPPSCNWEQMALLTDSLNRSRTFPLLLCIINLLSDREYELVREVQSKKNPRGESILRGASARRDASSPKAQTREKILRAKLTEVEDLL